MDAKVKQFIDDATLKNGAEQFWSYYIHTRRIRLHYISL